MVIDATRSMKDILEIDPTDVIAPRVKMPRELYSKAVSACAFEDREFDDLVVELVTHWWERWKRKGKSPMPPMGSKKYDRIVTNASKMMGAARRMAQVKPKP